MRGDGRLYRKPASRFWWCAYFNGGREVRESTGEIDEQKAKRFLRKKIAGVLEGTAIPHADRLTLGDLLGMVQMDYEVTGKTSLKTLKYSTQHLLDYFGAGAKVRHLTTDRLTAYAAHRKTEAAALGSIKIELALFGRGCTLAVRAGRLLHRPAMPALGTDPGAVRQGFLNRSEVEDLCTHLPADLADVVLFLFWSGWRVGEARTLTWRDYDKHDRVLRLRPEHSKSRYARVLPLVGELATILERRVACRRLDVPQIFHEAGTPIGDFRKRWATACKAIGKPDAIVHDLRRSGIKHQINAGIDPHTVMAFSGHRTAAMLKRYHIIALDDLRRAAQQSSAYAGSAPAVTPLPENPDRTRTVGSQEAGAATGASR